MDDQNLESANQTHSETCLAKLSKPVICVVGPTASGKTRLAQELALAVDGEVLSADSMQIYRGMDIGTGKISENEQRVPHHGIDLCAPDESYSVALYQAYARKCFWEIDAQGKRGILCGGTGLYIKAVIDDYTFPKGDQSNNPIRERYTRIAKQEGFQMLWDLLNKQDPASAALIHPHNVRRVVRAFEMIEEGTSYAKQHHNYQSMQQIIPACFIGLKVTPDILRKRIDARVDAMIEKGLIEEVKTLLKQGFRKSITAPQAIGYKELVAALDGKISFEEAIEQIKIASHRYAKRQRTWFKADNRINWLNADSENVKDLFRQAYELINLKETE